MTIPTAEIRIPPKLVPVFEGEARTRGAFGGRGSGKTRTFAKMALVRGYIWGMNGARGQILCGREYMNSLDDSSLAELKAAVYDEPWLQVYWEVGEKYIRSRDGNIYFTFAGLRRNIDSIKSRSRILLAWIDEAEGVSEAAWRKLIPTVREAGSEIWVTWNPESKHSATHQRYRVNPPTGAKIVEINHRDNPWFTDELEYERQEDLRLRPDTYEHIWEGKFLVHTEGAYYSRELALAREQGRIGTVHWEPNVPVTTAWDLGIGDSTAIWFVQQVGTEHRVIDYHHDSGVGLDAYARALQNKPYVYGKHILPHDVKVKELGTGKSRYEVLRQLGVSPIIIAPQLSVDDGIQAVRSTMAVCYFDEQKCEDGLDALAQYHREWNEDMKVWKSRPEHDWASHGADAFRYYAVGSRPGKADSGPLRRNLRGVA